MPRVTNVEHYRRHQFLQMLFSEYLRVRGPLNIAFGGHWYCVSVPGCRAVGGHWRPTARAFMP